MDFTSSLQLICPINNAHQKKALNDNYVIMSKGMALNVTIHTIDNNNRDNFISLY